MTREMTASLRCSDCSKEKYTKPTVKGSPRLPSGWKRRDDEVYCNHCWRKRYIIRAVTIPVAGPVGREWSDLRTALAECWQQSTELANWAVTELAKADVVRTAADKRLPPMPHVYLYPAARGRVPKMDSMSVVAVLHAVEQRYRKSRLDVVWRSEAALPRYRYPVPYPIHQKGWRPRRGQNGEALIDLRLASEPFTLRLRGGHEYRRQLGAFAEIVSGDAVQCELALYRQRASGGDHRPGVEDRDTTRSQRVHYRVMCKLVAWLPRQESNRTRTGTLLLRTAPDSFWIAEVNSRDPWVIYADHVRRWVAQHRRALDRLAQDSKQSNHLPEQMRRQIADRREMIVERHRRRTETWCHQAAAMVASYANRLGLTDVRYDDTIRSYVSEFPWYRLRAMLQTKLDELGMTIITNAESAETPDDDSTGEDPIQADRAA